MLVAPLVLALSLSVNTVLWLWTSWILPNRPTPPWRTLLPGSIVGAVGLEALKIAGAYVVPLMVAKSSALYGTIGVVFALIAWLWVLGRLVVLVTFERECPASHDAFRRAMVKCAEVLQCYSIGGQYDFVLIVKAASPAAYEAWSARVLAPLPDIRRFDAFVVWSTVKFATKFPLAQVAGTV